MIIYAHTITPRLQYIADFIGTEIGGKNFFQLTSDAVFYKQSRDCRINYSNNRITENEFFIPPHPLLFEEGIKETKTDCFEISGYKAFFRISGDFGFDVFAASFYLLSRYEEYLPHQKDMYGRYAHENSLAFREKFLHVPLVNIWLQQFRKALQAIFPTSVFPSPDPKLSFLPTYDIDQAYSYKYKSFWKNAGGFIKTILAGRRSQHTARWKVLSGKSRDPFDSYEWMDQLHQKYNLRPFYFFIVAARPGRYDKNISPAKKAMQDLILRHYYKYHIGIHPSWQSGDTIPLLAKEKQQLEKITGHAIVTSRQHYIRFTLPATFRQLVQAGIENDFSMGYGSINGFRASVASAFYWYDLEKNEPTRLYLYPFCYMDANSFYEQKYSASQALAEMKQYHESVKEVNGTMVSIWHNNFLGTDKAYTGWKEAYENFIKEITAP